MEVLWRCRTRKHHGATPGPSSYDPDPTVTLITPPRPPRPPGPSATASRSWGPRPTVRPLDEGALVLEHPDGRCLDEGRRPDRQRPDCCAAYVRTPDVRPDPAHRRVTDHGPDLDSPTGSPGADEGSLAQRDRSRRAATSAVSTGWTRVPTADTPGTEVRSNPSTAWTSGCRSQQAARASQLVVGDPAAVEDDGVAGDLAGRPVAAAAARRPPGGRGPRSRATAAVGNHGIRQRSPRPGLEAEMVCGRGWSVTMATTSTPAWAGSRALSSSHARHPRRRLAAPQEARGDRPSAAAHRW